MRNNPLGKLAGRRLVRFGVIGVGGMGKGHCATLGTVRQARLAAVCDTDPGAAAQAARQFGVPSFPTHRRLIESGLCDAVTIATPHPAHGPIAIDCLEAGLPVLVEKPMAERISMAEKMVRVARKSRTPLAVMFQRRFEPVFAKALQLTAAGAIGEVYRTCLISPEFRTQSYYDSGSWRATWAGEGGGVMMNQAPHVMDLFIQLGGMPCAVYGRTETRMHRIEVEDLAEALLRYPNGGTGYLACSTNEFGPGQMIELFGDRGKLVYRDGALRLFRFKPAIRTCITRARGPWEKPSLHEVPLKIDGQAPGQAAVLRNLVRHLLRGEPLVTEAQTAWASLELANAITLSAHEDRWVTLPIRRAAYDRLLAERRRTSSFVKPGRRDQRVTDPRLAP